MQKIQIIIFGGTTEGRLLGEYASELKLPAFVSVATDYGEQLIKESEYLHILKKRMDEEAMNAFFESNDIRIIIDATHPFAKEVTKNIKNVAEKRNLKYYRVVRENTGGERKWQEGGVLWFNHLEDIIDYLNHNEGDIFVTTGSKDIAKIAKIKDACKRCVLRILDVPQMVETCCEMGFDRERIIAKRGPFSYEENKRDFSGYHCQYLVTKESGKAGGFSEKVKAATDVGMEVLAIKRPQEEGIQMEEMKKRLKAFAGSQTERPTELGNESQKKICIVGIGMEGKNTITVEGKRWIENADLLIGAKRMVESVTKYRESEESPKLFVGNVKETGQKEIFVSYDSDEIAGTIKKSNHKNIVVLMSGDCGFFSGCKKLLEKMDGYDVKIVSGISSAVYFANAIGISWQDMNFVSLHGTCSNVITEIKSHAKTFFLLGGTMGVGDLCFKMMEYGYGNLQVYAGENLGLENERILSGKAKSMTGADFSGLSVMLVLNHEPEDNPLFGIQDDAFIREKVPMTKSEIRAVVMSKLNIKKTDVCWDLGCGTGSVSVEMANFAIKGSVYSIDQNARAIKLTRQNARKFGCDNIITVLRNLSEGLDDLPVPDVVFIGGGSGSLLEVLKVVLKKNPNCKIMITAVSVETIAAIIRMQEEQNFNIEMTQIAVTRTKNIGEHTMFCAANPIILAMINV